MKHITSLQQLINTLNECDPQDYVALASRLNIPKDEFQKFTFWKKEGYARNCIERTSTYELILICWKPGDQSPVHGHDEQKCWVHQVDGTLKEDRFNEENGELVHCNSMELSPGTLSYMEDRMGYHSLTNRSTQRAMTLHLYISPIDACEVFDPTEKRFKIKEVEYDSYKGVLKEKTASL